MEESRGVCSICRRQVAKYTCPKCNLPYCSLSCFRSETHMQCSETFYKREVETDILSAPKSDKERRDMLALLQRFEETNNEEDATNNALLDDPDGADLAERIAGLDLDAADTDDLWEALDKDQRQRFLEIIRNADGVPARELLAEETSSVPWWAAVEDTEDEANSNHVRLPEPLHVDIALVNKAQAMTGPPLLYNVLALCIVYAHTVRTYALISLSASLPLDRPAILQTLSELLPFIVERRSTSVFASVEEAVAFFWSRNASLSAQHMVQLLDDAKELLLPVPVSVISTSAEGEDAMPQHRTLRMLSDLSSFFTAASAPKPLAHVPPKLLFYGAHALAQPLQVFSLLRAEIDAQVVTAESKRER
ncbi:hypothetical protein EXIGLDRAFT_685330 [Exidia glandulosa HHB12029]|uniref:HIT-type domain-containing protein n=1 Tax=Exidia glandulosa HHB12029 TaxID=1314781 RepID=A0A165C988_EXIGL|nr:hypothetical protein EXIGLDRAFT_685330 [Exidia glandulosa HHB12029]